MRNLSRRQRLGIVLGLLLLVGLGWLFWPFVAGTGQMRSFCGSLAAGSSLTQVQALAAQHGYRVSPLIEGHAFVHDPRSFGRFTCDVQFGPDGLVSSSFSYND